MSGNNQDTGKFIDFTIEDIRDYLAELKQLIMSNHYIISTRQENDEFAFEYRINTGMEKEILLNLQYTDFCYAAANYKPEYSHERLFVFCKQYELDHWGTFEVVEIYIKTNVTQTRSGSDYLIVISFHQLNNPIKYLFKEQKI